MKKLHEKSMDIEKITLNDSTQNTLLCKKISEDSYDHDEIYFALQGELMVTITLAEYRHLVSELATEKQRNNEMFMKLKALEASDSDSEDKDVPF